MPPGKWNPTYGSRLYRFGEVPHPFGQNGPYKHCKIGHLTLLCGPDRDIVPPAAIHYDRARPASDTPALR
ncbi:hypothetical protein Ate02nite_71470 [Paractinoplanes tereljensis]|uniref:Uncharacterized protein n=1 Tax=Paractinoplanes tereljensis TaxID=571912 RepID=A0A919NVZ7_9ACTN|nr:hypothetical protein Ate02nite_71470 [Actinoplanes tereljensis]